MKLTNILWLMALIVCASCSAQPQTAVPLTSTPEPSPTSEPVSTATATPVLTPTPPDWLITDAELVLPAPLYYMAAANTDPACAADHIARVAAAGSAPEAVGLCTLWDPIDGFDVSPLDGSIVMAARGALWILDANGGEPRRLIDGLPNPEAEGDLANIHDPVWSPDGRWVAYSDGGMRIVEVASGERTDIIEDECFDDGLNSVVSPCFYGVWYQEPAWSPDGSMLLFRSQNADYFYRMLYSLSGDAPPVEAPGTAGVNLDDIAWTRDSAALLLDYWWPVAPLLPAHDEPAFVRLNGMTGETDVIWEHGDRADPVYASAGNNPWQVHYPFEAPDGRILFFQAESCESGSCYQYSLAEAVPVEDGYEIRILKPNALPRGVWTAVWHDSGEYVAFSDRQENGPWYIMVMRVSTGEMFLVAEMDDPPLYLQWGVVE